MEFQKVFQGILHAGPLVQLPGAGYRSPLIFSAVSATVLPRQE